MKREIKCYNLYLNKCSLRPECLAVVKFHSSPTLFKNRTKHPYRTSGHKLLRQGGGHCTLRFQKDYAPQSVVCGFVRVTLHGYTLLGRDCFPCCHYSEWIKLLHRFQFSQEPLISNKMQFYLIYNNVFEDLAEENVIKDPLN